MTEPLFTRADLEPAMGLAGEFFLDYYEGLEGLRVAPAVDREALERRFSGTLAEEGIGLEAMLAEFKEHVLPNSMGTPHPLYCGLINSSPLPGGVLGDLFVSTLNNNGGAFHQSPAMSALETEVLRAFGELFSIPHAAGMVLPGGSFANLQGLLLARTRHFPDWRMSGAAAGDQPRLYTGEGHHFSISRSAQVIGIGEDNVIPIPGAGRGEIDVRALAEAIERDKSAGARPFCVVATLGTTGTGALDPVAEIADLCEREGLWLHVDACYGGAAVQLPEFAAVFRGVERADSIAVDPHKWFFIPLTAGLLLTRHPQIEAQAFDLDASYVPGSSSDSYRRGIPTSRRSSAATVWMALRAHGWRTVREAVERNNDVTRHLERELASRGFNVLEGGRLSVACARWEPAGLSPDETDELQDRIAQAAVESGRTWFATVRHHDATWLRFCFVNLYTRRLHVEELAELVAQLAIRIAKVSPREASPRG